MNSQIQQQTPPVGARRMQNGSSYGSSYSHAKRPANPRDGEPSMMPSLLNGLSLNGQRGASKYNTVKGAMGPNMEVPAAHSHPYNGQVVILPNGSVLNGVSSVPQLAPGSVHGHDQVAQTPYLPTNLYPNLNTASYSVVPNGIQGYSWPYLLNYDVQDFSSHKKIPWTAGENFHGPGSLTSGSASSHTGNGSSLSALTSTQPCFPLQMMKTPSGYILQDMETLTQQDPAIPRAVPAMWTNPTELTLAKCLENREGITNVYIRGFLPETTDELLYSYASRFGKIERCKAIVDLDTGLCKGYVSERNSSPCPIADRVDQVRICPVL